MEWLDDKSLFFFPWNANLKKDITSYHIVFSVKDPKQVSSKALKFYGTVQ